VGACKGRSSGTPKELIRSYPGAHRELSDREAPRELLGGTPQEQGRIND